MRNETKMRNDLVLLKKKIRLLISKKRPPHVNNKEDHKEPL